MLTPARPFTDRETPKLPYYFVFACCFLAFAVTHLLVNLVFLRANHFPFVALSPDDFANLNFSTPFVPARPFSYLWVYLFAQAGETGFFILLNTLFALTCTVAFLSLARVVNLRRAEIGLAIVPFAILTCSLDFMGDYTRLTGLIPNLMSLMFGYLAIAVLCNEGRIRNRYGFLLLIALLQSLGALSKEDFFHLPIITFVYLVTCREKNDLFSRKSAVTLAVLALAPAICIFLQKNSSGFLQQAQLASSELSPNFSLRAIYSALKHYHVAYHFVRLGELVVAAYAIGFLARGLETQMGSMIKRDRDIVFLILICLLSRFPYLLLPNHLLPHYLINWTVAEVFLAVYLFLRTYELAKARGSLRVSMGVLVVFLTAVACVPKLTGKHRSAYLDFYRPLAQSHAKLYEVCANNKEFINNSEVVAVIGNTSNFSVRHTPFDEVGATHLANKGIAPRKWVRYIDPKKHATAQLVVDFYRSLGIVSNIEFMNEDEALSLCKKNRWPAIHYRDQEIAFLKNE